MTTHRAALGLLAAPAIIPMAQAQSAWPDRPIRLIVAYPAGGGTDLMARAVAQKLGEILGQPIVVANRSGAEW